MAKKQKESKNNESAGVIVAYDAIRQMVNPEDETELAAIAEDMDALSILLNSWIEVLRNEEPTQGTLDTMQLYFQRQFSRTADTIRGIADRNRLIRTK